MRSIPASSESLVTEIYNARMILNVK